MRLLKTLVLVGLLKDVLAFLVGECIGPKAALERYSGTFED